MQIILAFSLNNKVYAVKMQQIANKYYATFQDEKLELKNARANETKQREGAGQEKEILKQSSFEEWTESLNKLLKHRKMKKRRRYNKELWLLLHFSTRFLSWTSAVAAIWKPYFLSSHNAFVLSIIEKEKLFYHFDEIFKRFHVENGEELLRTCVESS